MSKKRGLVRGIVASFAISGGAALAGCGGDGESDVSSNPPSNNVELTQSPLPATTEMLTPALTEAPTPEPEPTPAEWSDESIFEELDKATGHTYVYWFRLNPESETLKAANTEAETAFQEYRTAHETGDFTSVHGTIENFANVGAVTRDFACQNPYAEVGGIIYLLWKDIVKNLGSRYETEGHIEIGTTEDYCSLWQSRQPASMKLS